MPPRPSDCPHPRRRRLVDTAPFGRTALAAAVAVALTVLQAAPASARDFLWKVTGKAGTVYLVGSVHMLTPDFYPLSQGLEEAFRESDLLVEEADLAELLAPQAQLLMLSRGMLPASQSLDTVIGAETYAAVARRVAALGLPIEPLKRFKPWSLALMLTQMEWQKAGFDGELGLDRHFYDRARSDGKRVQGLETAEFQVAQLDGIPLTLQERMLAEAVDDVDSEMANISTLAKAWKNGDVPTVERIVLEDMKTEPAIYERLLVARNRNWLPQIEALFTRPGRAFVVVGAAHLVGTDGLIAMLRAKGYQLEQM
ncbi:MAG: TraB/GumN family protein [Acidobacteriota bacterium]